MSNYWTNSGVVTYHNSTQITKLKANSQNFYKEKQSKYEKQSIFRGLLTHQLNNKMQKVNTLKLTQIAEYIPFLFSKNYIPPPLIVILAGLYLKIDYNKPQNDLQSMIENQVLEQLAQKAVFQSVKNGAPFLNYALDEFQSKMSVVQSVKQSALYKKVYEKIITGFTALDALYRTVFKTGAPVLGQVKKFDQQTFINFRTYSDLWKILFSNLRPYGQFLINFQLVRTLATKRMNNGTLFYTFWSSPQLQICIRNAQIQVYRVQNGTYNYIKQALFTKKYILQLIRQKTTKNGVKVVQQFDKLANTLNTNDKIVEQYNKLFA